MRVERQNSGSHRPSIGADGPFEQLRSYHSLPFDPIELALCASNDLAYELPIDLAIHHHSFEIDECCRSRNGRGNGCAGFIEPAVGDRPYVGVKSPMIVRRRSRRSSLSHTLFEHKPRRRMQ